MADDRKSPAVFAGTKYYEKLLEAMNDTKSMNHNGEFVAWVGALRQIANWCAPFISDETIFDDLERLHNKAGSIMCGDRKMREMLSSKLRDEIFGMERRLYSAMQDLLLKFGGTESTEWDQNEMRRMMG